MAAVGATLRIRRKAGKIIAAHRQRSCHGKIRHEDHATADGVRLRMEAQFGSPFAAYHCRHCGGFHVGNDKGGNSDGREEQVEGAFDGRA